MDNKKWEQIRELNDVKEAIEKIRKIQQLIEYPHRQGMIDALKDSKTKAPIEIITLELSQGGTYPMPFECFSDAELYRKLSQYQQGLEMYCIEKIGKQMYDKLRGE